MAEELVTGAADALINAMGVDNVGALHKQVDPKLAREAKKQLQDELDQVTQDKHEEILNARRAGGPAMRQAVKNYEEARRSAGVIHSPQSSFTMPRLLRRTFSRTTSFFRGTPRVSDSDSLPSGSPVASEPLSNEFGRSRSTSPQFESTSPAESEVRQISHQGMKQRVVQYAINQERKLQERREEIAARAEKIRIYLAHKEWKTGQEKDIADKKKSEAQEAARQQANRLLAEQNALRLAQQAAAEKKREADAARKQEKAQQLRQVEEDIKLRGSTYEKQELKVKQESKREEELRLRMERLNRKPTLAETQAEIKKAIERKYPSEVSRPKPETIGQQRGEAAAKTIRNLSTLSPYLRYRMGI
tara:strand:- start:330 stop:1412 length:1083 start_codon:yes stop_codon:yes gene_type:complete